MLRDVLVNVVLATFQLLLIWTTRLQRLRLIAFQLIDALSAARQDRPYIMARLQWLVFQVFAILCRRELASVEWRVKVDCPIASLCI